MILLVPILISLLFLIFFTGMKNAYINVNKLSIEIEKHKSSFKSNLLTIFTSEPQYFIATMQIGYIITLVCFELLMAWQILPILQNNIPFIFVNLLIFILITSPILLIANGIIPETLFKTYSAKMLSFFALPVLCFYLILYPIAYLYIHLSKWIIKNIFRQEIISENEKQLYTMSDLGHLINHPTSKNGTIEQEEEDTEVELFKNALDFSKVKVRDCMIPRTDIEALELTSGIEELREKFIDTGFSKILIFNDNADNIIGYVHSSQMYKNPKKIKEVLHAVSYVPETMMASTLLSTFTKQHKSIAVVVDEFGGTSGIVTTEDVLEEIFGEIEDEHDTDDLIIKNIKDNEWILSARHEISLLNTKYHFNLPENDEYETIAGLILTQHEKIPKPKSIIEIENFEFKVLKASETRIELVSMKIVTNN